MDFGVTLERRTGSRLSYAIRRVAASGGIGLIGNIGLVICVIFCLAAIFGPLVVPVNANSLITTPFLRPSAHFWFGTDELGRSELSRVVVASRIGILAAVESVGVGICLGTPMGVIAGYFGGFIDEVLGQADGPVVLRPGDAAGHRRDRRAGTGAQPCDIGPRHSVFSSVRPDRSYGHHRGAWSGICRGGPPGPPEHPVDHRAPCRAEHRHPGVGDGGAHVVEC